MPILTLPITPDGYPVEVLIAVSGADATAYQGRGTPIPAPIHAAGELDTGSTLTCVAAVILRQLGISRKGQHKTQTTAGQFKVNLFDVSLSILWANRLFFTVSDLTVMEIAAPLKETEVIVGRDVLNECLFISNGPQKQFTLAS